MVKVRYSEGVAIHTDPESCADAREGIGEALTGGACRRGIERRKQCSGADAVVQAEGNRQGSVIARTLATPRRH